MKRTPLRTRSLKKATDDWKYRCARTEHFLEHPNCQAPGCTKSLLKGDLIDLHHAAGRNGPLLYYKPFFRTACRAHHERVKADPKWAESIGWLVRVSSEFVHQLRQKEIIEGKI